MQRVRDNEGIASYLVIGADIKNGHHSDLFDFDEKVLTKSMILLSMITYQLSVKEVK